MSGALAGESSIETVAGFAKMPLAADAAMLKGSTMHTLKPGSIGVMLDDTRIPPRMFELTDEPHRMGIAYFAPLDDPLARVAHRMAEFWPLIDSLP